eukprot:scaffold528_cov126-Isochrysis_galbana.AAC.7
MVAAIAPLQRASSGRMEKGSSIWMPISSMPSRKKAIMVVAGMVAQWFHESAIAGQMAKGRKRRKVARKREVCRVYTSGTGDLKTRSHAPVRSTSVEMDASIREREMGSMLALRTAADIALSMNMGRFLAAMHASTCDTLICPLVTIDMSSLRKVASSLGPRRKLRSALAYAAVLRVWSLREECVCLPNHIAAAVDHATPEGAGLVPAEVGRVRPEHKQQGQRRHADGEGHRGQREGLDVAEKGNVLQRRRVHGATEILVPREPHIGEHAEDGNRRRHGKLLAEALSHAGIADGPQVLDEALRRAVLHPLVVHVHSAAVLSRVLGIGRTALHVPRAHWRIQLVHRGLVHHVTTHALLVHRGHVNRVARLLHADGRTAQPRDRDGPARCVQDGRRRARQERELEERQGCDQHRAAAGRLPGARAGPPSRGDAPGCGGSQRFPGGSGAVQTAAVLFCVEEGGKAGAIPPMRLAGAV